MRYFFKSGLYIVVIAWLILDILRYLLLMASVRWDWLVFHNVLVTGTPFSTLFILLWVAYIILRRVDRSDTVIKDPPDAALHKAVRNAADWGMDSKEIRDIVVAALKDEPLESSGDHRKHTAQSHKGQH